MSRGNQRVIAGVGGGLTSRSQKRKQTGDPTERCGGQRARKRVPSLKPAPCLDWVRGSSRVRETPQRGRVPPNPAMHVCSENVVPGDCQQ